MTEVLRVLAAHRSTLLILTGFGCLVAAAFLFHVIAGLIVLGLSAFAIDFLDTADTGDEHPPPLRGTAGRQSR